MAASCISMSSLSSVVASKVDCSLLRPLNRLTLAVPSVSSACPLEAASKAVSFSSISLFSFGKRGARRNQAIAARAADLDQDIDFDVDAPFPDSSYGAPPEEGTKLYVGNLPWSVHSQQLAEVFEQYGKVVLVEVIYDKETQRSRGFAFVTMNTVEDANAVIEKLDGAEIDGRQIKVNFPQPRDSSRVGGGGFRSERPPPRMGMGMGAGFNSPNKLFVGNLPWGCDDVGLDQLFSEYGNVVEAKVVFDRDSGRSRGFGFVTYSNSTEVTEAISHLDGAEYEGRLLRVNLAGDKPAPRPREF